MVANSLGLKGDTENVRKLKIHKKSRKGCGNCRLRKVKCDERKPYCKRCEVYGIVCGYDPSKFELQSATYGGSNHHWPIVSHSQMVLNIINSAREVSSSLGCSNALLDPYEISSPSLEVLYRFHTRTVLSLGPTYLQQAQQHIYSKLAYSHKFLLHCVLTLTIVHDQYLRSSPSVEDNVAIAFHWSQAALLLNEKLSSGSTPSERDALWACAALLGVLAFSSIEANIPEQAWPLHPNANLDWLRLTEGKKEIWKIAQPTRKDSIFEPVMPDFLRYASPNAATLAELERLPARLLQLCKFDDNSLHLDNPYYSTASLLAHTIDMECVNENVGRFYSFFGSMNTEFKRLLHRKDPCAMLILGYWYAKLCHCQQWYSWRRSYLESQAICKYLLENHAHDEDIVSTVRDLQTKCAAEKPWRPVSQLHNEVRTIRPLLG